MWWLGEVEGPEIWTLVKAINWPGMWRPAHRHVDGISWRARTLGPWAPSSSCLPCQFAGSVVLSGMPWAWPAVLLELFCLVAVVSDFC